MEKDRSVAIIEELKNRVVEGQSFPLQPAKVVISRQETLELLEQLEGTVAEELKAYRDVTDKRAKILNDAKKEAEKIIFEAEKSASRIRVTKRREGEPLNFSPAEMAAEEKQALRTAGDIYAASLIYTDEMLTEVDHLLADAFDQLDQEYKAMQGMLRDKMNAITENKSELLRSLNSLTKDDRYAQIMELSQLLSVELYREKEKQKAKEKEKASQMEIQFDMEETPEGTVPVIPGINPDRTPVPADRSAAAPEHEPVRQDRPPVIQDRPPVNPDRTPVAPGHTPVQERPRINPDRTPVQERPRVNPERTPVQEHPRVNPDRTPVQERPRVSADRALFSKERALEEKKHEAPRKSPKTTKPKQ